MTVWAVGGALRDCAAALAVFDLDCALEVDSYEAVLALASDVAAATGGSAEARAPALGTAEVTVGAVKIDLAALRCERYARPGALPTATFGATIDQDLARRDFSVNAMALALSGPRRGDFVDPEHGLDDLRMRWLRVLHDRSFVDDATRLWRGARTAAQHRLRPDRHTAALIAGGTRWLDAISGERLYAEFRYSARRRHFLGTLRLADRWGVLAASAPGLALADES
ncbi:MAG: CCA tRNA nucleotidyltransferase, partial [Chloroflexi bacterium]|nr:CCA tRNA nucleotidyltransferase [Chloroflexota bacterium]